MKLHSILPLGALSLALALPVSAATSITLINNEPCLVKGSFVIDPDDRTAAFSETLQIFFEDVPERNIHTRGHDVVIWMEWHEPMTNQYWDFGSGATVALHGDEEAYGHYDMWSVTSKVVGDELHGEFVFYSDACTRGLPETGSGLAMLGVALGVMGVGRRVMRKGS